MSIAAAAVSWAWRSLHEGSPTGPPDIALGVEERLVYAIVFFVRMQVTLVYDAG